MLARCFKVLQNVAKRIQDASKWNPVAPKCLQNDAKSLHLAAFWMHFRAFWTTSEALWNSLEPFRSILPPFCSIFYHFPAFCSTSMHFEVVGIGPERAWRIPECATRSLLQVRRYFKKHKYTYVYAGGAPGLAPYCAIRIRYEKIRFILE